jgi:hypothetical protein
VYYPSLSVWWCRVADESQRYVGRVFLSGVAILPISQLVPCKRSLFNPFAGFVCVMQEERFELCLICLPCTNCLRARVGLLGRRNSVHENMSRAERRLTAESTDGKIVGERDEVEVVRVLGRCCRCESVSSPCSQASVKFRSVLPFLSPHFHSYSLIFMSFGMDSNHLACSALCVAWEC